jgi:hypothetical protein
LSICGYSSKMFPSKWQLGSLAVVVSRGCLLCAVWCFSIRLQCICEMAEVGNEKLIEHYPYDYYN